MSAWENTGLLEGDIMTYNRKARNGVIDDTYRWPNATIPLFIQEKHFNETEVELIIQAIRDYHTMTCLRFKPYEVSDDNWVVITGNQWGCWSSIGMQGVGGQHLNLQTGSKCMTKGTVIHELLHAAGFLHQHSASNRDDFIEILWENVFPPQKSSFRKIPATSITDFNTTYDYASILHYSAKAFSKNGEPTIVPLQNITVVLGQRKGFSVIDIHKVNQMYEEFCHPPDDVEESMSDLEWFRTLFN